MLQLKQLTENKSTLTFQMQENGNLTPKNFTDSLEGIAKETVSVRDDCDCPTH